MLRTFGEDGVATGRARARWQRWWPFGLLVAAGASRWILEGLRPEAGSTPGSEALGCAWAGLVVVLLLPGTPRPGRRLARDGRGWLAGALLLGGPASGLLIGGNAVSANGMTIALALTPVAVAIAGAALETGSSAASADGVAGRIWPGLAAVAGLLLVLAQPSLTDGRGDAALLLAPVLTGLGAALFCAEASGAGVTERRGGDAEATVTKARVTAALAGGAVLFGLAAGLRWLVAGVRPEIALSAVACDGLLALLGVVALQRLGGTRWSAQFALLPLLILVEGLVLVRPGVTAHWLVGLGLLALASVSLLAPPEEEPEDEAVLAPR